MSQRCPVAQKCREKSKVWSLVEIGLVGLVIMSKDQKNHTKRRPEEVDASSCGVILNEYQLDEKLCKRINGSSTLLSKCLISSWARGLFSTSSLSRDFTALIIFVKSDLNAVGVAPNTMSRTNPDAKFSTASSFLLTSVLEILKSRSPRETIPI
ncbi:hypothetical protein OGATHE_004034 [Ogataea polymorpha]|uniref:Uncharacterized protein n=1 Tax=Ogataea polymorpha TaxID=460523 RepID=A0A9P8P5U2_9ASCO|nr:hypothetical protein OGATHE_004034 [Ogataea polymorpha]